MLQKFMFSPLAKIGKFNLFKFNELISKYFYFNLIKIRYYTILVLCSTSLFYSLINYTYFNFKYYTIILLYLHNILWSVIYLELIILKKL